MGDYINHERNVRFEHRDPVPAVRSLGELQDLIRSENKPGGRKIKLIGGRHTFNHLLKTSDYLIDSEKITDRDFRDEVEVTSQSKRQAIVGAGMPLWKANHELAKERLHFRGMGGWHSQSIGGLVATSTHGSSLFHGSFSDDVVDLEVITADGRRAWVGESETEELKAWRCHLGVLGVVTRIKFQFSREFWLRCEISDGMRGDKGFDMIEDLLTTNPSEITRPYVNMLWMPYMGLSKHGKCWIRTLVKTTKRIRNDKALKREAEALELKTERLREMHADARQAYNVGKNWLERKFLTGSGPIGGLYQRGIVNRFRKDEGVIDRSFRVFPYGQYREPTANQLLRSVSNVEYAIDGSKLKTVWKEMRDLLHAYKKVEDKVINYPRIHFRFANASDKTLIGLNQGRRTVYVGTYFSLAMDPQGLNREIALGLGEILSDAGGRPHWGKYRFFDDDDSFLDSYPHWNKFEEIRARLDPNGVFSDGIEMFGNLNPNLNYGEIEDVVDTDPRDADPSFFPIDLVLPGNENPGPFKTQSKADADARNREEDEERERLKKLIRRRR